MISATDVLEMLRTAAAARQDPGLQYAATAEAADRDYALPQQGPALQPSTRPNRPLTTAAPRAPQAAAEDVVSTSPSPTLTPGVAATAQPRSPFELAPGDQSALDRLAAFGAALASTRSPTFQGAFGEGVQALMRQRQAQTQEARQQQQVDVEQEYRRAVVANQAAELAEQRNPDNPLYQLRRAQTAATLAEADLRRRQAANVGASSRTERLGPGLQGTRNGQPGIYYPQVDRWVPFSGDFVPARTAEQEARQASLEDQRYLGARSRAVTEMSADMRTAALTGAAREDEIERRTTEILRRRPSQAGAAPAASTGPQSRPNVDRFDYTPPR